MKLNNKRAKLAMTMIGIVLIVQLLLIVNQITLALFLQNIDVDQGLDQEGILALETINMNTSVVALLWLTTYLISSITFIMWFRRAYYNLHQLVPYLRFSEGWAAGSWFVPFLNLVRPFQILRELFDESNELLEKHYGNKEIFASGQLIGVYWIGFILYYVVDQIHRTQEPILSAANSAWWDVVSFSIYFLVGLALLRLVYNYSLIEDHLHQITPEDPEKV